MTPHTHDYEFAPLPATTIALRVADVAVGEGEARSRGPRGRAKMWDSGVCRGAAFSDPAGNRILRSPPLRAVPRRIHALMQVEHVDFVSFLTQDIPRAKHFYSDVLGLEIETEGHSNMEFRMRSGDARHLRPVEHRSALRAEPGGCRASRPGRRRRAWRARGTRCRVRRRDPRDRGLPHGVLQGSRRQFASSPSEVCAP